MHQHPIVFPGAQFGQTNQAIEHRVGPFAATVGTLDTFIAGVRQRRPIRIVHRQAHHQTAQLRVVEEAVEGMFEDAFAGQLQVLLGPVGEHTGADTCGWDQGPEGRQYGRSHSFN